MYKYTDFVCEKHFHKNKSQKKVYMNLTQLIGTLHNTCRDRGSNSRHLTSSHLKCVIWPERFLTKKITKHKFPFIVTNLNVLVLDERKAQPPQVRTMTVPFLYSLHKGPHHVETICCLLFWHCNFMHYIQFI